MDVIREYLSTVNAREKETQVPDVNITVQKEEYIQYILMGRSNSIQVKKLYIYSLNLRESEKSDCGPGLSAC
eukprot:SAG31_NODE_5622_length_2419_cov_3.644397_1_plen_72_part_00